MADNNWLDRQPSYVRVFLTVVAVVALLLLTVLALAAGSAPEWVPDDSLTRDTLIPPDADNGKHYTPATLKVRPATDFPPVAYAAPGSLRWRMGVCIPDSSPLFFAWPLDRPGWFLNWSTNAVRREAFGGLWQTVDLRLPDTRLGMQYTPVVRMRNGRLYPSTAMLRDLAAQRPGLTWLIGNEPDVLWQDNTPPEIYAIAYHRAYNAIKQGDPTATVAIGGLSQITPLRLTYLDRMWTFYEKLYGEPMPVDVWNMHAFVLREERNGWGVNIPPGFEIEQRGEMWEVQDHDNLALVEQEVRSMRQWMQRHGQQDKPLWITEYGILMPAEFGFTPERVSRFMVRSFDLFRTLADPALGLPSDDGRLVQRWNWYSTRDSRYAAGNLFDDRGQLTLVGKAYFAYLAGE